MKHVYVMKTVAPERIAMIGYVLRPRAREGDA